MHCDFSNLIGNSQAKQMLSSLIAQGRIPHVLLFYGPQGVGKGLFAHQLAKTLLKTSQVEHPDLHMLHPDPDSEQHLITTLRKVIQEVQLPPFQATCKIFIIHEAEKMLSTSMNTLLKTLEEPPIDTYFILITTEPSSLLPTVISRCSKIPFYPVADEELSLFLAKESTGVDSKKIAILSGGSVSGALARCKNSNISFSANEFFSCTSYVDIYRFLNSQKILSTELSSVEVDRIFEDILYWIRENNNLKIHEAMPLIQNARIAFFHHITLKNILENFLIQYCLFNK